LREGASRRWSSSALRFLSRLGGASRNFLEEGVEYLAAPVSGNAKVIKAGKLTFVVSGPKAAYETARPIST
jgi:3-hydroxyisobutyrate dehydrogenase-like beta-hydroxyacid dehydrogenase